MSLCDSMDCPPSGSTVHGISQIRIVEWVAIYSSRGSSWSRDQIFISCIGRGNLYCRATREAQMQNSCMKGKIWGGVRSAGCVSFFWLVGREIRRCYSWNVLLSLKLPSSLWSHVSQPCVTQWSYDPCHVGPPKMDGSWWRVLTKHGPLEKGMGNHFSILALRVAWTEWKGKKIWHSKLKPPGMQVSNML